MIISCPHVGQLVTVRKRPFVVREVIPSTVTDSIEQRTVSHLLKLSSVEDDGPGEELQIIWELELGTVVYEKSILPEPSSFDDPGSGPLLDPRALACSGATFGAPGSVHGMLCCT